MGRRKSGDVKDVPSLRRSSRSTRFSGTYKHVSRTRAVKVHSSPPPDPDSEMMCVWFPSPETLEHINVKNIHQSMSDNAHFSAETLAAHAAKHAPKVPASIHQKIRHQNAVLFPTWYKYDENDGEMNDKLTLVCSDGGCHSWTEQSSGIPWIAVHGVDQICVVIIETYKIVGRSSMPVRGIGLGILTSFKHRVVAEMEAIESHQLIHQSFKKGPFAVDFMSSADVK